MDRQDIFDRLPTIIAIVSAYAFVASVVYNISYFKEYGYTGLNLLVISDYLQGAIIALPYCFIVLLFLSLNYWTQTLIVRRRTGLGMRIKLLISNLLFLPFIVIAYLLGVNIYAKSEYLFPSIDVCVMLVISAIVTIIVVFDIIENIKNLSLGKKLLIILLSYGVTVPYYIGEVASNLNQSAMNNHYIYINGKVSKNATIVRYMERGVLLSSTCRLGLDFISWDEIKNIRYVVNPGNKKFDCTLDDLIAP